MELLVRGLALGFAIAAPVGPIGVLCIRRTLADGRLIGFVSGLGAATADAFYSATAAFGLTVVADLLVGQHIWVRLIGGLFLCYLGLRVLLRRPATRPAQTAPVAHRGLAGAYISTLALTLTNPATILTFAAIFVGLGLAGTTRRAGTAGHAGAALLVLGVFLGSALWWLILSGGVALLRARFTARAMRAVNLVSGLLLLGFAALALASLLTP
jgi:threonine/homoserine/homoserine lactone efflux protein